MTRAFSFFLSLSQKGKKDLIDIAQNQKCYEFEEVIEFLETADLSSDIKIVLVAESFHPEIIITADWLKNYGITIYAFAIVTHTIGDETHLRFDQRYPLKELTEVYESRKKTTVRNELKKLSWEDVISSCEYKFAEKAVTMCRKFQDGDPSRKRFIHVIKNFQGFDAITFFFRRKYINIYLKGGDEDLFNYILNKIPKTVQTSSWRDGYSIQLTSEKELIAFIELDKRFNY